MTQTAILNLCTENIKAIDIEDKLQLAESTSPSYILMSSLDINCDLMENYGKKLISEWWKEYCYFDSGRDQLALPYVLWKNNIPIERVATMGYNAYRDSKIFIKNHDV